MSAVCACSWILSSTIPATSTGGSSRAERARITPITTIIYGVRARPCAANAARRTTGRACSRAARGNTTRGWTNTICTCSPKSSPTSTWITRRCARRSSASCSSGWTWAWTASARMSLPLFPRLRGCRIPTRGSPRPTAINTTQTARGCTSTSWSSSAMCSTATTASPSAKAR